MRDPIFFVVVLFVALGLATEDDYDERRSRAGNGDSVSNQRAAPPPSGDVQQGADCCPHKSAHHKGTK